MYILAAGLVAVAILFLLPRFLVRRQEQMLKQYEVLEKRFGFSRSTSSSRWGKGIAERHSLHGDSRGYPVSLYGHFVKDAAGKREWTSLVFEVLFTEELLFCIEFSGTQKDAKFDKTEGLSEIGPKVWASEPAFGRVLKDNLVLDGLDKFASKAEVGAIRLSKGFIEYRELGPMLTEAQRTRFQEAIVLLANVSDALSVYMSDRTHS